MSTMKIFSLLEKAVFCGRTVQSRIPYRTAAQQYRTVPSRPTSFFPLPYRTGTVRYGIGTAYRRSLFHTELFSLCNLLD